MFSLVFWIPLSILVHCVVRNICTSLDTSFQCVCVSWTPLSRFCSWTREPNSCMVWSDPVCFFFVGQKTWPTVWGEHKVHLLPSKCKFPLLWSLVIVCTKIVATITKLIQFHVAILTDLFSKDWIRRHGGWLFRSKCLHKKKSKLTFRFLRDLLPLKLMVKDHH